MKICSRCKQQKPLEQFYRKTGRSGAAYGKPCQHAYLREYDRKNLTRQRRCRYVLAEKYTDRNRRFVRDYLRRHPCVDCGERDTIVLEFDHVRGTKIHDIAWMIADCFSTKRLEAEIAKCVVRCANCHRRKTASERRARVATEIAMWDGWGSNPRPAG